MRKKFGYDWTLTSLREQMARAAQYEYDRWDGEPDGQLPPGVAQTICWRIAAAMGGEISSEVNFDTWFTDINGEVVMNAGADGEYYYVWIPKNVYLEECDHVWYKKPGARMFSGDIRIEAAK